jgi:hypothetical protein
MKREGENILQRFERKSIRRIYGPVRQRMEWRTRKKIYTKRRGGRPKVRRLDDEGWRRKAQDRDLWRRIAEEAKAHEGLYSQVVVVQDSKLTPLAVSVAYYRVPMV